MKRHSGFSIYANGLDIENMLCHFIVAKRKGLCYTLKREFLEETNILVEPKKVIRIRFNAHDWYVAFRAEYVSGEAASDKDENSEVVWLEVNEALKREDVPDLTKKLIECAINDEKGFVLLPYEGKSRHGKGYLYGVDIAEKNNR